MIRRLERLACKLVDLAMATDNEREAVAAILKARKIDKLRRAVPEGIDGVVQEKAVDLTLAWTRDGQSRPMGQVPELFTAATNPAIPALVLHHPQEFADDPTPYLGRKTLHGVPHRPQLPAPAREDEGTPTCPRSEFD